MCQAIGLRPSQKYEIGRPSVRMARLLREHATRPIDEITRLFGQVAFRALVGDEDGHGKNYSIYLDDGVVTLSALYDSLCTLVYKELSGKMGTPIGTQQNLAKVDRQALLLEGAAMGLADAEARLSALAAQMEESIGTLPESVIAGWDSVSVIEVIVARLRRLRANEPLGLDGPAPLREATLDELTR